ncbi:hypothetical protein V8B97DRAFT_1978863 [Scleroderma yunnanense]
MPTDSDDYIPADYRFHAQYLDQEEQRPRRRLPIPDLRFEQTYLSRIRGCLHIEPQSHAPTGEDGDYAAVTHVVPLINPSQQVISVDWQNVAYITLRDQVLMPLLQGMLWGVVGTYYKPFISFAKESFHCKSTAHPGEGEGVSWLRGWARKLGFSNIAVGPWNMRGWS